MVSALDGKGRDVLTEGQITIMAMLYSSLKKHEFINPTILNEDLKDFHMFLDVIAMSGIALITQDSINGMWNILLRERAKT